ncbi:hypothetical protein [Methylocella sp.]|uniref:hypothetical protein n=1 Tax=Methylocella sp. TaxID=1978226 RepID=UPI003783F653
MTYRSRWGGTVERVALAAALAFGAGAARAQTTHCREGESTFFSCQLRAAVLSICGGADGAIQYRFGPLGAAKLVLPSKPADQGVVSSGLLTFSGGGGAYVAFANSPFRYVVYTAIVRGEGDRAGVVIERSGRRIGALTCSAAPKSELGPELFARLGLARDASGFDLP